MFPAHKIIAELSIHEINDTKEIKEYRSCFILHIDTCEHQLINLFQFSNPFPQDCVIMMH